MLKQLLFIRIGVTIRRWLNSGSVIAEGYETHFAQKQSRNNRQEVLAQVNELLWVFVRGLIGPRQIKSKQRECQTGNAWLLTNL
jgi:hypothetical protein